MNTSWYPISTLMASEEGGRLSAERARKLYDDLVELRAARARARAEARTYPVTGGQA